MLERSYLLLELVVVLLKVHNLFIGLPQFSEELVVVLIELRHFALVHLLRYLGWFGGRPMLG